MSNGPLPSVRCLLSELSTREVGDKVRFLGCVASYSIKTATLTLEHSCPQGSIMKAAVDVKLLLQSLKNGETDFGQWVHVIGYITSDGKMSTVSKFRPGTTIVGVQALVLWTARDLDIAAYETALLNG